jgi:hypothetical protein
MVGPCAQLTGTSNASCTRFGPCRPAAPFVDVHHVVVAGAEGLVLGPMPVLAKQVREPLGQGVTDLAA